MVIKLLNVLRMAALLAAAGIIVQCVCLWWGGDSQDSVFRAEPNDAARFTGPTDRNSMQRDEMDSPLVAAARAFASVLNPPVVSIPSKPRLVVRETMSPAEPLPVPIMESPKFKVFGTSCSESHPERSMALIAEIGIESDAQWMKEGAVIGHFAIHEIRDGVVICLAGERRCELAVEQQLPSVVTTQDGRLTVAGTPQGNNETTTAKNSAPGPLKRPGGATGPRVGSARSGAIN